MITAFVNLDPEYVTPTVEKTPENGELKCSIIGIRLASDELLSEWADKISKNPSNLGKALLKSRQFRMQSNQKNLIRLFQGKL